MRDFTLETFKLLLLELKAQGYTFQTFRDFLKTPAPKAIVLRHDVDARKLNSLQTARLEADLEIAGTYNFRIVPQSFDVEVIRQIAALGHEVGYHYEDLALAKGNMDAALQLFEQHLAKLRQVAPIDTICMHGSPLSRYDNRKMWGKFDYRDYGITGEPYFDVDFSKVMYLTDTGRRWDGERVSIRDKVGTKDKGQGTPSFAEPAWPAGRATAGKRDKGQGRMGMEREDGVEKGQEVTAGDQGSKLKDQKEDSKSTIPLWRACPDSSGGQGDPPSLNLPGRQAGLRRVKGEDQKKPSFHSTFDIINAAKSGTLPAQLMINVHPQRWDNRLLPWLKELIWQRVKNGVKGVIAWGNGLKQPI